MKMSGSRVIIECLREQHVDTVFGYPGGAILPLYDALQNAPIRHILTVHEQGAAHAADGYARASGKLGVCIATSGPGATNLVTGLATAYMDSVPVVAITGQVGTSLLGRDAFQGVDVTGITMPITKHNFLVQSADELAATLRQAFSVALEGRPGPILVDVPRNVLTAECEFYPAQSKPHPALCSSFLGSSVEEALALLLNSKRPVMLVGGGVRSGQAQKEVRRLAEITGIPVVSTLMGLGAFPSSTSGYLGLTGMHGHKAANLTIAHSDLILTVGSRLSDRVTSDRNHYAIGKSIIHIDVDASEIGRNITANVELVGDLQTLLSALIEKFESTIIPDLSEWRRYVEGLHENDSFSSNPATLNPEWIMRHMSDAARSQSAVWVTDVGQHQMWAAQHLDLSQPRSWITSGGMGTMGFGLPAAMGAQLACPSSRAIAICGDGGFKMTAMELYTIATNSIPVICVIINNHTLGMVRQLQHVFCDHRYTSVNLADFDFSGFAKICGVRGHDASTPGEFAAAFARALDYQGPTVIVADISSQHMVNPMVTPGQTVDQFVNLKPNHEEVA